MRGTDAGTGTSSVSEEPDTPNARFRQRRLEAIRYRVAARISTLDRQRASDAAHLAAVDPIMRGRVDPRSRKVKATVACGGPIDASWPACAILAGAVPPDAT